MVPYYDHAGITIFCGDAREIASQLEADSCITDPVWPNSVFPNVPDPQALCTQVLAQVNVRRVALHLGCNSDPRFLQAVPSKWPFFRVVSLEYAQCSYVGRLLYTGDVAYLFGAPPAARPGAMVIPGRCVSTKSDSPARGTGRNRHKSKSADVYAGLPHPAPRHLKHARWLVKWFGGTSVLDPFCGTGTTLLACKSLGIPGVGIELEERYCAIAVERLRQEVLELPEDQALAV